MYLIILSRTNFYYLFVYFMPTCVLLLSGAAIRYSPSIDWPENESASSSLALLAPIKIEFPDITWSDLIVLAGQTAIESAGGLSMPFCGGRVDANNGDKSIGLEDKIYNNNGPAEGTPEHAILAKKHGFEYCTLLGELMFCYTTFCPDIGYAITTLSKFSSHPNDFHYRMLK